MLSRQTSSPAQLAPMLQRKCVEENDTDACMSLQDPKFGMAKQGLFQAAPPIALADGGYSGETLLAPEEFMEPGDLPTTEEDPLLPLKEILGEEAFLEMQEAAATYPVVAVLAEMATATQDGSIDGLGGPKDDMVPARLSPGEFVFSKEAVDEIGLDTLERIHEEAKLKAGAG